MRVVVLLALFLALPGHSATVYGDFAAWSQAVGSFQSEGFDGYGELILPTAGGTTQLDRIAIENDAYGTFNGTWRITDDGLLIVSTEDNDDIEESPETSGPAYIDVIFDQPVSAYGWWLQSSEDTNVNWCHTEENPTPCFYGVVLDALEAPASRVTIASSEPPSNCHHSTCRFDSVHWTPVPEPGTGLLVAVGLWLVALRRRGYGL